MALLPIVPFQQSYIVFLIFLEKHGSNRSDEEESRSLYGRGGAAAVAIGGSAGSERTPAAFTTGFEGWALRGSQAAS